MVSSRCARNSAAMPRQARGAAAVLARTFMRKTHGKGMPYGSHGGWRVRRSGRNYFVLRLFACSWWPGAPWIKRARHCWSADLARPALSGLLCHGRGVWFCPSDFFQYVFSNRFCGRASGRLSMLVVNRIPVEECCCFRSRCTRSLIALTVPRALNSSL
eukprot:Amastigsp_a676928_38.p1 type:complete len:159 gc:universal Amastigsp_a676928_38:44-520(+)